MSKFTDKIKDIKLVKTLTNIWRIEDLRSRILITLLFVAIYRFGSYVVLPGIDTEALQGLKNQTEGGLMSLLYTCFCEFKKTFQSNNALGSGSLKINLMRMKS